jgi:hypothetical protein
VTRGAGRPVPVSSGAGLLGKLMATVRPQFRVEVYLPDPDDRVLGRPLCRVAGCDRSGWEHELCSSHGRRWRERGCPDLTVFLADPGPPVHGRIELPACTVGGCRYGINSLGLCMRHRGSWARSGTPDPAAWAAELAAIPDGDHAQCRLPFCTLWTEHSRHLFCRSHQNRWRLLGCPDVEDFIDHCLTRGKARIDFRGLTPQLTLEFQYAVQRRYDQQSITAPPPVVNWAIRIAANAGVSSLLEHDEEWWRELTASKVTNSYQSFLVHARTVVEVLRDGAGWDVEYTRATSGGCTPFPA